jgi:hypothetical protein
MDGKPVIKASALGTLMGSNAAHTACALVTANMAMAPAVAEAINPSSTAKITCMRSSTSQTKTKPVTASGMPAVLNKPKASLANASHPMVTLAFAKNASSDVLQKAQ